MTRSDWIDAKTACHLLGIRPQTLYAYVSRGLLRASSDPGDPRRSLYAKVDVDGLAARHRRPRARAEVASQAIRWGDPVLNTAISGVRDGVLFFGERPATECAQSMTLEQVAAHHWRQEVPVVRSTQAVVDMVGPLENGLAFLARSAARDQPVLGLGRRAMAGQGAALLSDAANALMGSARSGPIHERLAGAWDLNPQGTNLLRQALVLMSDHELNPSTFAVRVCASTGASLPAALLAGLATLSGPRHGGVADKARQTVEAGMAGDAAFLRRASATPYQHGFSHPLYPLGDVRAAFLLDALDQDAPPVQSLRRIASEVQMHPNIDAALAAFAIAYALPREAAFIIFAVGRMVGWIAHAIEQAESETLIRPRAEFIAPQA